MGANKNKQTKPNKSKQTQGGDGGQLVWAEIKRVAAVLDKVHPSAGVWVSAQDLSGDGFDQFWRNVSSAYADGYLAGVVFGPHVSRKPFLPKICSRTH